MLVFMKRGSLKKSAAQLQREIDTALGVPSWAKGLDLKESRMLEKRLRVSQDALEMKERRSEEMRRAALPALTITNEGNGIFVRVGTVGPGYSKFHAVLQTLKKSNILTREAVPPHIFVPVRKGTDKTEALAKVKDALSGAGYFVHIS